MGGTLIINLIAMSEKAYGRRLAEEMGPTLQLNLALGAAARKLAGQGFISLRSLSEAMSREIWNPWNYDGGIWYVRATVDRVMNSVELLGQIGVSTVRTSTWYDRLLFRKATRLELGEPPGAELLDSVVHIDKAEAVLVEEPEA